MPNYRNAAKRRAREFNVLQYQRMTERGFLAGSEEYWTLLDCSSDEIETLERIGFLRNRKQFCGINRSQQACNKYAKKYGVRTLTGSVGMLLAEYPPCPRGGLFYLDTMYSIRGRRGIPLINMALANSGSCTLIAYNLCVDRHTPRAQLDDLLQQHLSSISIPPKCQLLDIGKNNEFNVYLPPKTAKTQMLTTFFWKE